MITSTGSSRKRRQVFLCCYPFNSKLVSHQCCGLASSWCRFWSGSDFRLVCRFGSGSDSRLWCRSPDPGPTPSFRHIGKSEQKIYPLFSPVPVYCTLSFLSHPRHRCHNFLYFKQFIEMLLKKSFVYLYFWLKSVLRIRDILVRIRNHLTRIRMRIREAQNIWIVSRSRSRSGMGKTKKNADQTGSTMLV